MVRLRNMTQDEFDAYKSYLIEDYAQEIVRNTGIPIDTARARSAADIDGLLTAGLATPNQLVYVIELEEAGTVDAIGTLWLDIDPENEFCHICDIEIRGAQRGRGFGRQALQLVEDQMRARGIARLTLNVATDNVSARNLYTAQGFEVTRYSMQKRLRD